MRPGSRAAKRRSRFQAAGRVLRDGWPFQLEETMTNKHECRSFRWAGLAVGFALLVTARGADAQPMALGYGSVTKGGAGGDVYQVTNLSDSGSGSLREGILDRNGPRIIRFKVGGTIKLKGEIKIGEPYLTIDGSTAPNPGITVEQATVATPALKIVATHDIIIHGIRSAGLWYPGGPYVKNDAGTISVDGDGAPGPPTPWDPNPHACGPSPQHLRNSCRIILDQVTLSGATDDGPDFWCGVADLTISRSLIIDSFHPRGTGCKGVYDEDHPHARLRITEYANVYAYNGERTPKLGEGVYDYDMINNIVFAWQDYTSEVGNGVGGYGTLWENDGAEDRHNVIGNVWMPDPGGQQKKACQSGTSQCREDWDCVWGFSPKWNNETNLWEDGLHYAENVFGPTHNKQECVSTDTGENPFPRPYKVPVHSTKSSASMEQVLDDAGVPRRTKRENQVLAAVRAALRARLGPGGGEPPPPEPEPEPEPRPEPRPTHHPPTDRQTPPPPREDRPNQRDERPAKREEDRRRDSLFEQLKRRTEQLYCDVVGC
jgi:pectate lyase